MKGYKGFDKDLKCRGFQYEVGKTYECEGKIALCENGFHFCEDPKRIRDYYTDLTVCRYCEIEASGEIIDGCDKCVCSKITIVREIPLQEFLSLVNEGKGNTGWMNEGNWNEGNWNKGNWNEGNWNEGNSNEGNWNEGNSNEGNSNDGNSNEGDRNKGDRNKGDRNIGSYNRGNDLCGLFNTDGGCVIFNGYTPMKHTKIEKMDGYYLLTNCIDSKVMPSDRELEKIKKLPNFDFEIMKKLILGNKKEKKAK